MRLVMTMVVRDEEDILETNLDYHLAQGVDFILVTDHGSRDRTPDILAHYERLGLAHVLHDPTEGHHQGRRVTEMARLGATTYEADWLLHNDADEFWWPELGSLSDIFAAIPSAYGRIEVRRRNFLPTAHEGAPFYERMVVREAESLNLIDRPLEPKVAHRADPNVVVAPGNHSIAGVDLAPAPPLELLEIFHFPIRSYPQFERKVIQIGSGYELLPDRSPDVGRDQLKLLELYRQGRLPDHFRGQVLDDDSRDAGLRDGRLILDRRLQRFLADRERDDPELERPESARARSLTAEALGLAAALDEQRADLEASRTEVAASREELSSSKQQLAAIHHSLELLRTSRLLRWTAPVRRAYYRARAARGIGGRR